MFVMGQKQTFKRLRLMSALPPKRTLELSRDVRFVPKADIAVLHSMTFVRRSQAARAESKSWGTIPRSSGLQNIVARSDKRWSLASLQIPSRPNLASAPSQIARARSPDV